MDGLSSLVKWEKAVKARDGYTCQECGKVGSGRAIVAHHIVRIEDDPSLKLSLDNGRTLCRPCHGVIHMPPAFPERDALVARLYGLGLTL